MRIRMSVSDPLETSAAPPQRWLSIIGIGEDGLEGLGAAPRHLISQAEVVFGGKRHLELAKPIIRGEVRPWPVPFDNAIDDVIAQRGRMTCVLASGDPMLHGVGALIARRVAPRETVIMPAPSAFSLAAARLGWALPEVASVSLHGRPVDLIRPHLQPGGRVLALTSDARGPLALAQLLTHTGFGGSRIAVLEALGGPRERIRSTTAVDFDLDEIDPLNVVAIDVAATRDARVITCGGGLADEMFEHDGQITKREVRAVSLSSLAPRLGELLWDIGAGSGSIAIEWMLCGPLMRAIAIETRTDRVARIRRNASALGVPSLDVVEGTAPAACDGLPTPDAIFVGGGVSDAGVIDTAIARLRAGGRAVVNAVTLPSEALLLARHATLGGQLLRLAVARVDTVGGMQAWRPARPVTQWIWVKP
jgi:precorrin-6B C5,15-methyltransferase / cobalt-precorrin-6B C5,C15-methyltransferase